MRASFLLIVVLVCVAGAQQADSDALLKRAIAAQGAGQFDAAIGDYREYLKVHPDVVEARVNLGAALAHQGKYDAAIEQYQAALPLAAQKDGIVMNLALAFYKKGDLAKARPEFEAVQRSRPMDVQVAILLGDTEIRLGDPASAVAMLQPLAGAGEGNLDFDYVYGLGLIRTGKLRDGAKLIQKVADTGGGADSYLLAGSTLLALNEYEGARRDLDEALKRNPKLPGVASIAGIARDKTGDTEGAEAAFRQALAQQPDDFNANLYLGAILYKKRDLPAAKPYLDRALELNPSSGMARYEAGMLKSTSGQMEEALADLKQASASDPKWLEPHVELAALFYKLHRPEEGAKERQIVERLTAEQQAAGTGQAAKP